MTFLQILISGLMIGSIYCIISIGTTLIYGTLRMINFCYGDFLMLGMYIVFWVSSILPFNAYFSMIPVAIICFGVGVGVFWFLIRPLVGKSSYLQILVTVGIGFVLQNLALFLWSANYRRVSTGFENSALRIGGISISISQLIAFIFAIILGMGLFLFLQKTRAGMAIRALSQNRRAATLMGINTSRFYALTYGLGIALAGVAGCVISPIYYIYPTCGAPFTTIAFIVVVMGGLGSYGGAIISGLIIGLIEALSSYFISPALNQTIYFLLFIVIILVKPSGLFGLGAGSEKVGFD